LNGQAVDHVRVWQEPSIQTPSVIPTLRHLSQMDLYLDSTTALPVALTFNIHPDNNMGLDIPVEIHFSDYRPISGVQVPFSVQKNLNNSLVLDLQFQTAIINSGLTANSFNIQ